MKSFRDKFSASCAVIGISASIVYAPAVFANPLSEQAYTKADQIFDDARVVHYEHLKQLAPDQVQFEGGTCVAKTDCSGFVSYILHSISPRHYEEIRSLQPQRRYPQAAAYARFFAALSASRPQRGWLRVDSLRDLRPGDVIAWARAQTAENHSGKGNTGHVMIVAQEPGADQVIFVSGQKVRYVPVLVIDSSSVRHFPPEQLPPRAAQQTRDGLGKGYVRIVVDDNNRPIGYWEGTYWGEGQKELRRPSYSEEIACGRLVPFDDAR